MTYSYSQEASPMKVVWRGTIGKDRHQRLDESEQDVQAVPNPI
jgi:hypothetical protein